MSINHTTRKIFNFSFHHPTREEREEQQRLLQDEEELPEDHIFDSCVASSADAPIAPNPHANLPVYTNIHRIRRDIITSIDDPYSVEQLKAPRINIAIIRPLVDKYYDLKDISIIYCLLVNKVQFTREHSIQPHHQSLNITRAIVCELVANKVLRRYNEDNVGHKGLLLLANILVAAFVPFQGAPEQVILENDRALHWIVRGSGNHERRLTALEVAIISSSKGFLASSACQRVVNSIYIGRITYSPTTFIDILPDHYKRKTISLYDPRRAPLLNQYRLVVPRTRNYLEIVQFIVLLVLYFLVMENRSGVGFTISELFFAVYAFGWILDQIASILEHGWQVYTQNLWSFLDVFFSIIYFIYLGLRLKGLFTHNHDASLQALEILAVAAPVLIPRLGFNILSENILFISLRSMMADFLVLTFLAVWLFGGFLLAMKWLGSGSHQTITISKWMLWVWFGLDGTGIQRSVDFHWLYGPVLMVSFAFLGNTLFLTILVSMLTNTFSNIVSNAAAEVQFRRAVLTFEGVKSDAIFAYQPPFNILAVFVLIPLKLIATPRWFHKINVTAVRILNAPLLFIIGSYERRFLWATSKHTQLQGKVCGPTKPRGSLRDLLGFSRLSVHSDIQAVFDSDPPPAALEDIPEEDEAGDGNILANKIFGDALPHINIDDSQAQRRHSSAAGNGDGASDKKPTQGLHSTWGLPNQARRLRKESLDSLAGLREHLPDILSHYDGGEKDIDSRLHELEESNKRIEEMLSKLTQNMDGKMVSDSDDPEDV